MDSDIKTPYTCHSCLLSLGGSGSIYITLPVRRFKSKVIVVNWFIDFPLGHRPEAPSDFRNKTTISSYKQSFAIPSSSETTTIIILVSVVFLVTVIASVVFVFYRKRLKHNLVEETKLQEDIVKLQELDEMKQGTTNLLSSEPNTPNQTDLPVRTFTYPVPRRRLSSSGSINSTTPLLRNRNGSYRSRFSSGLSSRIDSSIAEGRDKRASSKTIRHSVYSTSPFTNQGKK